MYYENHTAVLGYAVNDGEIGSGLRTGASGSQLLHIKKIRLPDENMGRNILL